MSDGIAQADFRRTLESLESQFSALSPELQLIVRDPAMGLEGYVTVWSTLNAVGGPLGRVGKGGTRITPTVTQGEIDRLARTQSLKNAAAGLALGGAKSGLRADPRAPGFEQIYRRFVELVSPVLYVNGGPWGGLGFDLGGQPIHVSWACDQAGHTRCITGKPVDMGGTDYDKEGIAGLGVAVAAQTMLQHAGHDISTTTAAIQGVGAMGAAVAKNFAAHGGLVVMISDPRLEGSWLLKEPLCGPLLDAIAEMDFTAAREHLESDGHERLPLDDVLFHDVDVLFPCAVGDVIDSSNAPRVRASAVVEGANFPCTNSAREALHERGVTLIPDFIANPGGAIAAFVEMTSSVSDEENASTAAKVVEAKETTERMVEANVREVLEMSSSNAVSPMDAGLLLAYRRILER
ncbi:MAG: hypothetical protein MK116_11980 [Phycisphaerales bacterium]|nr:hypothetical protein [Phycisphaerales bacterium]